MSKQVLFSIFACCAFFPAYALADPVTYDCTLIEDTARGGYLRELEQMIIDRENRSIVFSRPHPSGDGTKMLMDMTQDAPERVTVEVDSRYIRAAGFWYAMMYFFEMDTDGRAVFTVSGPFFPSSSFRWDCH